MDVMAQVAADRAAAWRLFAEVVRGPDADLVAQLHDGRFLDRVHAVGAWLGEDGPLAQQEVGLRTVMMRARRDAGPGEDLAALREDWVRLFGGDHDGVETFYDDAASACDEESEAWRSGDHEAAKRLRLGQFESLQRNLEPVADWCRRLHAGTTTYTGKALARTMAAHLTAETGRDLLASICSANAPGK